MKSEAFPDDLCHIFTVPFYQKACNKCLTCFIPCYSLSCKFKHIHQGNLDREVLSCSLFSNLSVFEESYHVYLQSLLPQTKCNFVESYIINHGFIKWNIFFTSFFFLLFFLNLSFLVFSLSDALPIPTPLPQSDSNLNYFLHLFHDFVTGLILESMFVLIVLCLPAFAKDDLKVL